MNNSTEILFSIGQSMYGFTMLVILAATIILFIKKRTPATWMILIGYLLVCIAYLTSLILITIAGRSSMETMLQIQGISSIAKSLSYLIFAIGLIMLAITEFSKKEI